MKLVQCGIKAFDIHELLCHFIAKRCGFYKEAGLEVRVIDVTFTADENLPASSYFQVACGAAYLGRREGFPFKVVLAATERPVFWLHAAADISSIEQLRGKRIASYPPVAPPYYFHRALLRKHGLDPDADVELWPARDDIIRLGMLREKDVDAAIISSAVSPFTVQQSGLNTLALVGDEVPFITTGVATTEKIIKEDPALVAALVDVFRQSLNVIHESGERVVPVLADILKVSEDIAQQTYEQIRHCYTTGGLVDMESAQRRADVVDVELKAGKKIRVEELYDYKFINN